ncbi:hypothetical protein MMC11_003781 [Xylographa trunciseda]|nr:hypothetical protein [Xylographa trunciseda]
MDTVGEKVGLEVTLVSSEGVVDVVLAEVVVFGKPVDNITPLELDVPVDKGIPEDTGEVRLDMPVEKGTRELSGDDVLFGYPVGIPLEAENVVLDVPVERGIMLEPVPEEVIFGLKIESGAVGPGELLKFPEEVGKFSVPVTVTVPLTSIVITDVLLMLVTMAVVKFTSVVVVTSAVVKIVDVTFAVIAVPFVVEVGAERMVPLSGWPVMLKVPELYEIELEELGADVEEVMSVSPLEPEDVRFEIMLALKGVLVLEGKILGLEIVLSKVELLGVFVGAEIGVLVTVIKETEELLLSIISEEIDVVGAIVDEFSPVAEKELG